MNPTPLMNFVVDNHNKTINVEREFAAPLERVWAAWTQSDLLDQWWAPKPWRARTKSMDFRPGGTWLYAMIGPDGEENWSKIDYTSIDPQKSFSALDGFCDENGVLNSDLPRSTWENVFTQQGESTLVRIGIRFEKLADLEKIIEMGFEEGFTAGLTNLDQLLSTQSNTQKQA